MKIEAIPAEATRFKETELGPLPEEWRVVRLGDLWKQGILWIKNGFSQGDFNEQGSGVPHLRPFNVNEWGEISLPQIKYVAPPPDNSPYWVYKGDVIFNNTNSEDLVGKVAYFDREGKFVLSNHMTIVRVQDSKVLNGAWLAKWLLHLGYQGFTQTLARRHVNQASISLARLRSIPIPLPPPPEQRAIAYVLRTVQEAKEATDRVIAALRELKKSLMRHLFTYGPVPVDATDRVELKETEIGPLPAHWRVVRLGEVVELRKGTVSPAEVPEARYVGLEHIDSGEIRIRRFGKASDTRSAKAIFHAGDILYGKLRPYLDKAALAEWDGVCSTDILVLISTEAVDRTFAAYLMHTDFVLHHAIATTTGVNHPRTSWKSLSQATIPLPPLSEQREIARILRSVDEHIEAEERKKAALEALFKTLLHHLMMAKIRLPEEFVARFAEATP
ncbi:restriction endonuclease [Thermus scotoductus]|uniref:Restriction endonuclease n=1 Tax=Thermus scotoductus TaxID=37636 RepID=A0A430RLS1_THESC|nr:restriction endonuclease subunit S [Thermus scotoductus]RTH18475.1 restriction endonuclease [Thermus scotoductus]